MDPLYRTTPPPQALSKTRGDGALRDVAQKLEATFLAEMLTSAGLGESRSLMGGGSGEDQFQSFLVRQQAEQIAKSGGIGLSETLFNALKEAQNEK
ncbi:chemotactic signal-response protein CheL [Falsiruegeria litorea R37]|uniref:Chemotactic signal-response protein CheL n=1 Tax=Falsiruegeria litorea R37 TaxID=1200284 RepID=A0A1Y5TDK8_9RHOB|nr:rod-binding protein [Falsiruegeria litorea]SLN61800.1 chemotactic signal-response protein CheL [Falsiruegeria litorea R37]